MDVGGGRSLGVLASTMLQAQDIEFRDARAKGGSENLVVRVVLFHQVVRAVLAALEFVESHPIVPSVHQFGFVNSEKACPALHV